MRNLQKILALVLALIMSFSLVATAGAFSDDGDISDSYKTAVNVLNGLEVFKGYDNGATFQPKGNITRAEVAAIIYRIATGDVTDSQASIYSTYGQFTDVADGSWYAGYVNYCANAGYIKGRGNKIFDPQGQVTGYEALAMILRAVGYDKNGEFTGSNWQIRTASIANQRGITKNVTEGMLGQAATRETVAEILFRAILVNQVDFNANTLSYTEKATSLGYDSLKLEEIEGVITANEYADLNEDDTLPDGRTEMLVDGKDYTIDYTTTLDDIGESHIAYIQNGKKVLAINDREEGNVTAESTAKIKDEDALKAFAKENSISLDKSAERYLNFSKGYRWMSDWRIRYEINFVSTFGGNDFNSAEAEYERERATYKWTVGLDEFKKSDGSYNVKQLPTGKYLWIYEASFKAGDEIGSDHQSNIQSIFDYADRFVEVKDQDTRDAYTYGEVYAGTSSLKDLSDSMSYNQFVTEYINQDTEATINDNENGNWVKIIDNDKDGVADYVLKVIYTTAQVDKVSDSAVTLDTKDIDFGSDEDNINEITSQKVVSADTLAVNDIVYYAVIDGKAQTYKATPVTAKIDKVNRNDLTATTADGTVYTQSGVCEHVYNPDYTPDVRGMADGVSYDMYLGRGDYMLVFVKSVAKSFTLLVDGYYNSTSKDDQYAVKAYQDGRINNVDVGRDGDLFIDGHTLNNGWGAMRKMGGTGNLSINAKDGDQTFLKTAVAGLDENGNLIPVDFASVYERGSHAMISIPKPVRSATQETYYTGIFKDGATEGYAYKTSKTAYDTPVVPVGEADNKVEIRALSSTVYYFVWKENNAYHVKEYVGYGAVPSLSVEELKTVEDIYAVGTRHERVSTSDKRGNTYYTADVVVVELNKAYKKSAEQIFVADSPIVGNGVRIDTLTVIRSNGVKKDIQVDLTKSILTYDVNYDEAGYKKVLPGVYNLYPTNEEGIYTIEYMNRNKIVSEGLSFMIGNVNTKQYTADSNYVGIDTMVTGGAKTYRSNGEFQKKLTADTKYYTLDYEPEVKNAAYDRQNARLDESTLSTVLKPRVEESKFIKDNFVYDLDREFDWQDRYGCYNNVLVCYDGSEAVYVVSFQNYDDDMPAARYGDHWELDAAGNRVGGYTDYAQHVWESMIPDPTVAQDTQTPTVELRTADGGKEQIAVLNPGTNDIPWAVWSKFAGRIDELYITPKANHSVSVDGKLSWTNQSKAFAAEEKNVPASNALTTDDGVGKTYSFRVVNQVSGGMTEVLDYSYSFVPVNTDARLLDRNGSEVAGVIEIPDNSGNIEGYLEANFKLGSEFSTAVWNFSGKNNEESAVTMTMDAAGVVTAANSNLRVNEFTEVMLNTEFDVTVTAQSGDTITYKVKVVPSAPVLPNHDTTKYDEAKAAFDAVEDLTAADETTLNNIKDLILKAQETADADGLTAEEIADLADMLAKVEAALTPETTKVDIKINAVRKDQTTPAGTAIGAKDVTVTNGKATLLAEQLYAGVGMAAGKWVVVAVYSDDGVMRGKGDLDEEGNSWWTISNIPQGVTEITLTVVLATEEESEGDIIIIYPQPAARIARAAGGVTETNISVWLPVGVEPGSCNTTDPNANVTPDFENASKVRIKAGVTVLWMVPVVIEGANLDIEAIVSIGISFGAKPVDPTDLTQAKADATKAVNEYKTTEIAALTGDDAAAAEKAKTDALAAIEAAESVDAVNKAVADYKAAIDALTAVTDNKLVVEAVPEKEKLIFAGKNDGKYVFEIQDPLTIDTAADGKTIHVSGISKYVSGWTDFSNKTELQSGYYIALALSCPGVPADSIWFKSVDGQAPGQGPNTGYKKLSKDGTNENGDEYGILVWKLSDNDQGVRKNIDVKIGNETFVIDLSGVKMGADNEVLMVEAVGADEQITETITSGVKDYGKKGGDIQNITVGELSGNTIKVTGTTKYVGTAWGKYGATNNTGFFVALKISYPGIKPTDIKGKYGGDPKALSKDNNAKAGDAGLALIRLDNDDLGRQKNFTVEVAGKTYIIDLRDVVKGATADVLTVEPVPADRELLRSKKGSDLQDIQVTGQDHDIKVTGKLKYVSNWTQFDAALKDGYYIALAVNHTGIERWDEIQLISSDGTTKKQLGVGDDIPENANVIIKKIDPQDKKTQSVKLEVKGIVYTVDLSGITYEDKLEITALKDDSELDSPWNTLKISDINNIDVVQDGETFKVTGDAYYVDSMTGFDGNLAKGYYIILDFKTDGVAIKVKGQESGDVTVTDDNMVRRLKVNNRGVPENISVEAFGKLFTIDVSELNLVDEFTLKASEQSAELYSDEEYKKPVSALQGSDLKVEVDENSKTFYVTGAVKYLSGWGAYGGNDNKGWFVALDYEYPVGGKLTWKSDLIPAGKELTDTPNDVDTIVTRIATTDMEIKNVTVVTGSGDTWTVDFSGVTLLGPDGTPITAAAAQALELGLEDAGFYGFEDEPEDIGFYGDVDFVD